MVRLGTIAGMTLGAFLFWESMDKVHVWIALHQDEKVFPFFNFHFSFCSFRNPKVIVSSY